MRPDLELLPRFLVTCGDRSTVVFLVLTTSICWAEVVVFQLRVRGREEPRSGHRIVVVKGRIDDKEGEVKLLAQEVAGVRGGRGA